MRTRKLKQTKNKETPIVDWERQMDVHINKHKHSTVVNSLRVEKVHFYLNICIKKSLFIVIMIHLDMNYLHVHTQAGLGLYS